MATLIDADLLTAIVTPFDENQKIDFASLEKLVNYLIDQGCNGFVVGGTTGETPTLTHDEKIDLYQHLVKLLMDVFRLLQERAVTTLQPLSPSPMR